MKSMCHEARRNSPSVAELQPDLLLLANDIADRLVFDRPELGGVDPSCGEGLSRLEELAAAGAGCRRARPGTAASSVRVLAVSVVACCTERDANGATLPSSCEDGSNARKGATMAAVESEVMEGRRFIARRVGRVLRGGGRPSTISIRSPATSWRTVSAGAREDARAADRGRRGRVPGVVAAPPAARQQVFLKAADAARDATGRGRLAARARDRLHLRLRHVPDRTSCPGLFRQAAALAYAPLGEVIPSDTGAFAMGLRRPVGVVGAIAPWNAALILSARSIAAPLALGNTVVLKPSELLADRRRAALGRDLRRGGPAARRPQHRHARAGRGRPDRRRAGREPARAQAQLHRLDRRPDASWPRPRAAT